DPPRVGAGAVVRGSRDQRGRNGDRRAATPHVRGRRDATGGEGRAARGAAPLLRAGHVGHGEDAGEAQEPDRGPAGAVLTRQRCGRATRITLPCVLAGLAVAGAETRRATTEMEPLLSLVERNQGIRLGSAVDGDRTSRTLPHFQLLRERGGGRGGGAAPATPPGRPPGAPAPP